MNEYIIGDNKEMLLIDLNYYNIIILYYQRLSKGLVFDVFNSAIPVTRLVLNP